MLSETYISGETIRVDWLPADELVLIQLHEKGTAMGWDLASEKVRYEIRVESSYTLLGSCSTGGDNFVLGSRADVRVIETRTGDILFVFETPGAENSDVRLSPNGRWLATGGSGTGDVKLWDLEKRALRSTVPGKRQVHSLRWSPDGRYLAAGCLGECLIWDIESEMEPQEFKTLGEITEIHWTPDQKSLIIGSDTMNDVLIYRISTAELHIPGPAGGGGGSVAWLRNGERFVRAYGDGTCTVFDAQDGLERFRVQAGEHWGLVNAIAGGKQMLTCNTDGRIARWDAETGELLLAIEGQDWAFIGTVSPDERKLGAYVEKAGFTGVILWDNETGAELWRLENPASHLGALAWSPEDGRLAVTFGLSGTAALLEPETGETVRWLLPEGKGRFASAIAWSHDGSRLAVFLDGVGHILDGSSGDLLKRLPETFSTCWFIQWTLDDRFLLMSDSSDGRLRLFEVETGAQVLEYDLGGWAVGRLSPDEKQLLASTNDGSSRIYPIWLELGDLIAHARKHCNLRDLTEDERQYFGLPVVGAGQKSDL